MAIHFDISSFIFGFVNALMKRKVNKTEKKQKDYQQHKLTRENILIYYFRISADWARWINRYRRSIYCSKLFIIIIITGIMTCETFNYQNSKKNYTSAKVHNKCGIWIHTYHMQFIINQVHSWISKNWNKNRISQQAVDFYIVWIRCFVLLFFFLSFSIPAIEDSICLFIHMLLHTRDCLYLVLRPLLSNPIRYFT